MILFATLSGEARYNIQPAVLVNIFLLLLAPTVGLFLHKRKETEAPNMLGDIKNALSAAVPYIIIVSLFLFFYYRNIDPEFNRHQIAEVEVSIDKTLSDEEEFQKLKDSNPDFEVWTKDVIRNKLMDNQRAVFSPGSTMTVAMLAMLVLSVVNAIVVSVVMRRMIFRPPGQ